VAAQEEADMRDELPIETDEQTRDRRSDEKERPMATQIKDTIIETFKLDRENVDKIIAKIEELIHEGNVRRVVIKDARGATIIEAPLTFGIFGVALLPLWAAIAAIAAIAADFTLQVERKPADDA